jgi:hypothetical protein
MPAIEFSRTHSYLPVADGISLPVFLNNGAERIKLLAHVDTGASQCLFERRHAELLNLDVEAGDQMAFRTAAGRVEAFGHLVTPRCLLFIRDHPGNCVQLPWLTVGTDR